VEPESIVKCLVLRIELKKNLTIFLCSEPVVDNNNIFSIKDCRFIILFIYITGAPYQYEDDLAEIYHQQTREDFDDENALNELLDEYDQNYEEENEHDATSDETEMKDYETENNNKQQDYSEVERQQDLASDEAEMKDYEAESKKQDSMNDEDEMQDYQRESKKESNDRVQRTQDSLNDEAEMQDYQAENKKESNDKLQQQDPVSDETEMQDYEKQDNKAGGEVDKDNKKKYFDEIEKELNEVEESEDEDEMDEAEMKEDDSEEESESGKTFKLFATLTCAQLLLFRDCMERLMSKVSFISHFIQSISIDHRPLRY